MSRPPEVSAGSRSRARRSTGTSAACRGIFEAADRMPVTDFATWQLLECELVVAASEIHHSHSHPRCARAARVSAR